MLRRLGFLARVKSDGGLVQGEAIDFRVKVKVARSRGGRCRGGWATGRLSWASSWGWSSLGSFFLSGNVEEVIKSRAGIWSTVGILGTRSGANAGLVLGLSREVLGSLLRLRSLGSGPSRVWDLGVLQLNSGGSPESFTRIDGVLLLDFVVVSSNQLLFASLGFGSGVAWQTTDVGELTLATIGVDVSVLSSGDAIDSTGLLSE